LTISPPARRRVNAPLVVLGAVLAVLGFVSVLLIGQGSGRVPAAGGSTAILVLARDVPARTILAKADLTTAQVGSADVPVGVITSANDAVGKVAQVDLKKGQPALANLFATPGDVGGGGTAFLPLPKGFVAFTIPTSEDTGVAGYIQAGDYIDIVAVVQKTNAPASVRTIYSSVHVIRLGPAPVDEGTAPNTTPAVRRGGLTSSLTIAVSECQAEYLTWFITNAQLRYTLLSYQDYQPDSTAPDASCPVVGSAHGVTDNDVRARWPGLL
jgi:pilus assembly protein CpaB